MDIIYGTIMLGLYFLPSIIATIYKKRAREGIFVINLFFGWTVFGWIICLAWSVIKDKE